MGYRNVGSGADVESTDGARTEPVEERARSESPDERLPLDVVFEILRNRRRRLVLRYLLDCDETTTLSDLAEHVAAVENDKPEEALTSSERKRVYVGLYQCHLPKMDDAGTVEFDSDRGTVELADHGEQFGRYLELEAGERDATWAPYYAALAVGGGGVLLGQQHLYPSAPVSHLLVSALIGSLALLALADTYHSRR